MKFSKILYYFSSFIYLTKCHVEMRFPPPRRSKYSQYYLQNNLVDYNLMAPINAGYSYPCKGYAKGPSTTTINGNIINIQLEGSAIHGGGHCQFGITTNDNDFLVLNTIIRNCLLSGMSYSIQLPNDFPNTEITVFWTWVNAIGNREYYMDCADITIDNGNTNTQSIITGLDLLVLNLPGYTTIPEFPNPGMYDGSELFDSRLQKSITINNQGQISSTQTTTTPSTQSTQTTQTTQNTQSTQSTQTTTTPSRRFTTTLKLNKNKFKNRNSISFYKLEKKCEE